MQITQELCLSGEEGSIVWWQEQEKMVLPSASDNQSQKWKKPQFVESSDNTDIKTSHVPISSFTE